MQILAVLHLQMFLASLPSKKSKKQQILCDQVQEAIDTTMKIIDGFLQDAELGSRPETTGMGKDWWEIGNKMLA